jgi:hypothetical protein
VNPTRNSRLRIYSAKLVPFLAMGAAFFAYRPIMDTFFVQDDFWFLNAVQQPVPNWMMVRGVLPDFFRPLPTYWLPWFNRVVWGLNPWGHHLSLMIVFLGTIYTIYSICLHLTGSALVALPAALIYGLSNLHLYTLGWISGGIDVLAAFFLALAIWAILRYISGEGKLWPTFLTFSLALLSKESTAILPFGVAVALVAQNKGFGGFTTRERRLVLSLFSILAIYMLVWVWLTHASYSPDSAIVFDLERTITVLKDSLAAAIPLPEASRRISAAWLLLPPLIGLFVMIRADRSRSVFPVSLSLSLWLLPALIFTFTSKPYELQLYYAHFSLIGLAMLFSLAAGAALDLANTSAWVWITRGGLTIFMLTFTFFSSEIVTSGIKSAASPSLFEASYSQSAYHAIKENLAGGAYDRIVLLDVSDLMWWSIGKGVMGVVMFPGYSLKIDGYDEFQAENEAKTDSDTLVLRQVTETDFVLVK